jgi:protease-4
MRRLSFALALLICLPLASRADDTKASSKEEKKTGTTKARLAVFRLASNITETPGDDSLAFLEAPGISLKDLVTRLRKAADDPAIKAVVFLHEKGTIGIAQIEEVRQAFKHIQAAGKKIYVHSDSLAMRDYVLLSGASRLSVVPTADLWITGLAGEAPYLRGLLDMIKVQPQFLTCGAYKSAAEIFMRTGPSPEADKMQNWLFDSIYATMVQEIAKGRHLKPEQVKELIDEGPYTARSAKEAGLIDAVEQRQDFEAMLKREFGQNLVFDKKYGKKKGPSIDFSSPFAMFKIMGEMMAQGRKSGAGKDAVGIVYVDGPITLGGGDASPFASGRIAYSSEIRKALDEAARDANIKAVVLRVDSPGGSAVASEIILDATRRVKAKKPFVVSMGDVAGSGGYYVACAADTIFADESTITASIGVVGGKFVTNDMWKSIGITFHPYQRGKNAAVLSSGKPWSEEDRQRVQKWMDEIYDVFKGHVVASRGKRLAKPIDELAGGRVFTGRQALELGLVDKIGTMQDAVEHVAGLAKIKDYEVRVVPEPKNLLERIIEEASGDQDDKPGLDLRQMGARRAGGLVNLAMPYLKDMDPERVLLIVRALERMQLIQQEGAVLMMPEMRIGR